MEIGRQRDPVAALPAGHSLEIIPPRDMSVMWGYLFALLQAGEYVQVGRSQIGSVGLFDIVLFTATHQECIQVTEVEGTQTACTMVTDGLVKLRAHSLVPPAVAVDSGAAAVTVATVEALDAMVDQDDG